MNVLFLTKLPDHSYAQFTGIPGVNMLFEDPASLPEEELRKTEVILGNPSRDLIRKCPSLRWIQLNSAGANNYSDLPEHILLTNASGAYGQAISEHMIACAMASIKNLLPYHDLQKDCVWKNLGPVPMMEDSVVLSVGMGDIGGHFLEKAKALGAYTIGIRRTSRQKPAYADEEFAFLQIRDVLPRADILGLSMPETAETAGMFDYGLLSLTKKDSVLINVGRGSAIVTDDLVRLVKEGHFRAVYLDVTDPEPLPADHPLWTLERVYITPHISGRFNSAATLANVKKIFLTNLTHYVSGEPLEHVVNRKLGY